MATEEIPKEVMRISWGPQHPISGQTRILIDTDGERVFNLIADIGFTHRGIEKILENRTFLQGLVPIDRMVMADTANISMGYVSAIEEALGIEAPPRAQYLRSMLCEMSRINSHLYAFGLAAEAGGGYPAVFLWSTVDREVILDLQEMLTGARWSYSYFIPGGVREDVPQGFKEKVLEAVKYLRERFQQYREAWIENALFEMRSKGVGVLKPEDAIRLGATGPVLRGSGVALDVRKDEPYAAYGELDFEVVTEEACDSLARLKVRAREMMESLNIIEQCAEELPPGPVRKVVPVFMRPKPGEYYSRVETARGELGIHLITDGGMRPYRVKISSPTLRNLWVFEQMPKLDEVLLADVPVILYSLDPWYLDSDR